MSSIKTKARAAEKQRLINQRDALILKYPAEVWTFLAEEPSDVLRHHREVVRFPLRSRAEEDEIAFNPPPCEAACARGRYAPVTAAPGPREAAEPRVFQGYSQGELEDAFRLVEPKPHWKGRISGTIARGSEAAVAAAVIFFTGCSPAFSAHPSLANMLNVTASGYWAAIGP